MVKCAACGAENRDIANYCLKCGQSVVVPPVPESPEGIETATNLLQPIARPQSCVYHPWLPSQTNCAMCGVPICMSCNRYIFGNAYCPICFARHSPPRLTLPFYLGPILPYAKYAYGRGPWARFREEARTQPALEWNNYDLETASFRRPIGYVST
jgi:hypothetical protein